MRTNFKFALMSAAALLSLGLASCSSNDEEAPVNPTYDGKAVKTQFTISVPGALNTRMTALDAQEDEKFSGMKDKEFLSLKICLNKGLNFGIFTFDFCIYRFIYSFSPCVFKPSLVVNPPIIVL